MTKRTSIFENEKLPRYVFGHYEAGAYRNGRIQTGEKGGYRFLGVFQMDLENPDFQKGRRIYRKIDDKVDLQRYAGVGDFYYPTLITLKNNDVAENIVSLCSNCHNEIHYGRDADILIRSLYSERKVVLEKAGIVLSVNDLLVMYGY